MLNYKAGPLYELANVFMLAWPYGNPMVMSSYRFEDGDQGPPATAPIAASGACDDAWVCEHRFPSITGMVGFRNVTDGMPVSNWQVMNESAIAFGRGSKGFVVINAGNTPITAALTTDMPPGRYCNVVAECGNDSHTVEADGSLQVSLPPVSALAIHTGRLEQH